MIGSRAPNEGTEAHLKPGLLRASRPLAAALASALALAIAARSRAQAPSGHRTAGKSIRGRSGSNSAEDRRCSHSRRASPRIRFLLTGSALRRARSHRATQLSTCCERRRGVARSRSHLRVVPKLGCKAVFEAWVQSSLVAPLAAQVLSPKSVDKGGNSCCWCFLPGR